MSDMSLPLTRSGGSDTYKRGILKRRLDSQLFATINPGIAVTGAATETARFKLTGLEGTIKVQIAAGYQMADGSYFDPTLYFIPGAVTMQLTPITAFGDALRMAGRPVFQDPAAAINQNFPLPMDLPFSWEFATESDEVWIDLVCTKNQALFVPPSFSIPINCVMQVTVEYNGAWWDTKAIKASLSEVKINNVNNIIVMASSGS